jgi:hypothetical protein
MSDSDGDGSGSYSESDVYRLDFGRYEGERFHDIPMHYILWLAGLSLTDRGKEVDDLETVATIIWKRSKGNMNADCECTQKHQLDCDYVILRPTTDGTYDALLRFIETDDCKHSCFQYLKHLGKYAEARDEARVYLRAECNRCWDCGRPLQPIGNRRKNGANHPDWDERRLHKQCWHRLVSGDPVF